MLGLIDYGVGNLKNLKNAFDHQNLPCSIVKTPTQVKACTHLVLPGVGAFVAAVERFRAMELEDCVKECVAQGTLLLGVCVGMQLLFDHSEEGEGGLGLGCIPGRVMRFAHAEYKVPLVGWVQVSRKTDDPLLAGIPDNSWYYFVHSYHAMPTNAQHVLGVAQYGTTFPAVVRKGNVWGVQFHPEKSQHAGLKLLHQFYHLCG